MICKYKSIPLEELQQIVYESITFAEVMRKLGYTQNRGNSYGQFKKYLVDNNIDVSHFKGRAHGTSDTTKYTLEDIFVKDTKYTNMTQLKNKIIKNNLLEYRCDICGITCWNDKPLTLQLDHINGDNRDNRLENLRFLCPNCHSQTETFCGKNKNKYKIL